MQVRKAWQVLFSKEEGADVPAVASSSAVRSRRERRRAQARGLLERLTPVQLAWFGGALAVAGCFMAPIAPAAWVVGKRARAALPEDASERDKWVAKWGHWLGRAVTWLAGIGLFMWLVGTAAR